MTEAHQLYPDSAPQPEADIPRPQLSVIAGPSETIRRMFSLLADGNAGVIDYRGTAKTGEGPRHVFPTYVGREVLRSVEED